MLQHRLRCNGKKVYSWLISYWQLYSCFPPLWRSVTSMQLSYWNDRSMPMEKAFSNGTFTPVEECALGCTKMLNLFLLLQLSYCTAEYWTSGDCNKMITWRCFEALTCQTLVYIYHGKTDLWVTVKAWGKGCYLAGTGIDVGALNASHDAQLVLLAGELMSAVPRAPFLSGTSMHVLLTVACSTLPIQQCYCKAR